MMKINKTILDALFENPRPQPDKEEVLQFYRELNNRIFPCRDNFISFLQAQTIDKQYEFATKIIHSLCFYSNFPPDYYALIDILHIEGYLRQTNGKTGSYIPRDHFLHIVNTYLLGIYVFFYNAEFYNRIIQENRFEREGQTRYENTKRNCVKDFISEWKYFCLFHDVGYSPEVFEKKDTSNVNRKTRVKRLKETGFHNSLCDNQILEHISFFSATEVLSRLIVASFVQDNAYDEISSSHKIFKAFSASELLCYDEVPKRFEPIKFEQIPEDIKVGKHLEKVYDNQCLKALLPIFGTNPITVVGVLRKTGRVIFISYYDSNEKRRVIVTTNDYVDHPEIQKIANSPELILFDEYFSQEFELEYILLQNNDFNSVSEIINPDYLENLFCLAKSELSNRFIGIADGRQFIDFQYTVYIWLYEKLKPYLINTSLSNLLAKTQGCFLETYDGWDETAIVKFLSTKKDAISKSLEGVYNNNIRDFCFKNIEEHIKNQMRTISCSKSNSTKEMISDVVKQLFDNVRTLATEPNYQEELTLDAQRQHLVMLEHDTSLLNLYVEIYLGLKYMFSRTQLTFSYDYEKSDFHVPTNPIFLENCIDQKIKQVMWGRDAKKVCEEYKIPHSNIDHGIVSAQYAASIFEIYRNAIDYAESKQERLLLSILLNIGGDISANRHRYVENYNHVFTEILFAVFTHNLYPSNFVTKNQDSLGSHDENRDLNEYRTSIKIPFSYLALLCDALQQWNRPHTLFPSRFESRPNEDASDEFDIKVKSNAIIVFEKGERSDQERLARNIQTLNQYLEDVDAFLKNGFTQVGPR